MKTYYIVETLNGNYILKAEDKLRDTDCVEMELYAETLEDAKKQFKEHVKGLK